MKGIRIVFGILLGLYSSGCATHLSRLNKEKSDFRFNSLEQTLMDDALEAAVEDLKLKELISGRWVKLLVTTGLADPVVVAEKGTTSSASMDTDIRRDVEAAMLRQLVKQGYAIGDATARAPVMRVHVSVYGVERQDQDTVARVRLKVSVIDTNGRGLGSGVGEAEKVLEDYSGGPSIRGP